MASCAECGAPDAPAVCTGRREASYCGPACQRAAWKAGHRELCRGRRAVAEQGSAVPKVRKQEEPVAEGQTEGPWPVRCPKEILRGPVPRLDRLDGKAAQEMLCEGTAFVAPMEKLLGTQLLRWDFDYLQQHLPSDQKYGVMLDEGSGKIVMSHSARNGQRQVDLERLAGQGGPQADRNDGSLFNTSDQTRMTFGDFLRNAEQFQKSGRKGKLPYFGLHVLWRFKPEDNGYLGQIDEEMAQDLWSINFDLIKEWQDTNLLPLIQRFYLFAGLGGTLYHCHYDLQPNIHVQLSGRKRFVLFPPESWPHLYPFPVHHDLDRRSMVDLDTPDIEKFPRWREAQGQIVELEPGDALYIPPYWWHHVQSLTPQTTSMAMWFFEYFPQSADVHYGIGPRAQDVVLMRDVEELVGKCFADAPGEEDCTKSRPVKAKQVAAYMRWLLAKLDGSVASARAQSDDEKLLADILHGKEDVLSMAVNYVVQRYEERAETRLSEAQARTILRSFVAGRFSIV